MSFPSFYLGRVKKLRVLVTGGSGFVGRNLVHLLHAKGHEVVVLHRSSSQLIGLPDGIQFRQGDVTRPETLEGCCEGIDWVFHVAGDVTWGKALKKGMYQINVNGARHIAEEAWKSGVKRFIHTSSAAAIGLPNKEIANESFHFNGDQLQVEYAIAKRKGEEIIYSYIQKGLRAVIVNPTVIIGIRTYRSTFVHSILKSPILAAPRGGINVSDVEDVVLGHLLAAERGKIGERYILGGTNLPLSELMERIHQAAGRKNTAFFIPTSVMKIFAISGEILSYVTHKDPPFAWDLAKLSGRNIYYSSEKAIQELGYTITPLEKTIKKILDWNSNLSSV